MFRSYYCVVGCIMKDDNKTKGELIEENNELKDIISKLRDTRMELRQAEKAYEREKKEKEAILNSMWEQVIFMDETFTILWTNRVTEENTDIKSTNMVGKPYKKVWSDKWREIKEKTFKSVLGEGTPQRKEIEIDDNYWLINLYPVFDERNNIQGIVETSLDITDRKTAKERLKEEEEKYENIFENIATPTIIVKEDKTICLANQEFEKLTGYTKQEIEDNMKWTEFVRGDDRNKLNNYHKKRREDPGSVPSHYKFEFEDKYGTSREVMVKVNLLPDTKRSIVSLVDLYDKEYKPLESEEEK